MEQLNLEIDETDCQQLISQMKKIPINIRDIWKFLLQRLRVAFLTGQR